MRMQVKLSNHVDNLVQSWNLTKTLNRCICDFTSKQFAWVSVAHWTYSETAQIIRVHERMTLTLFFFCFF